MNKLEKIMTTIIIICLGWMLVQTIYGVGRAKGFVEGQKTTCEEQVAWAIQNTSDDLLVACEQKITQMENQCDDLIEEAKEEVLAQF